MIPDDAWPAGDLIEWADDETRIHHDFFSAEPDVVTRPYTDDEDAAADERAAVAQAGKNETTLRTQAASGLADNATFLALTAPTNAQTLAQVKALTRQMTALISLTTRETS
ncbi:MAG: hypothetical protein H0X12_15815 [Nocardioides sp.]|nr:hypothetical protein [Nocardioides sp.]